MKTIEREPGICGTKENGMCGGTAAKGLRPLACRTVLDQAGDPRPVTGTGTYLVLCTRLQWP